MSEINWTTQKRIVRDLIPYPENPRLLTDKQAKDLEKSIRKFNLVEIPVVNVDNVVIAGHMRLKTMVLIGRGDEEIEVRVPTRKLSDAELKEYNVRSNKNTGSWDFEMLANSFDTPMLMEVGFTEFELTGASEESTNSNVIDCPHCTKKIKLSNRVKKVEKVEETHG